MMEKIPWTVILSMCFKIALIYLICSKISSKISSASETAVLKRVGSIDEKYHRLVNESHLPHLELDHVTAKSHNSTDEDDGSRIIVTPFFCSNTILNDRVLELAPKDFYTTSALERCFLAHRSNGIKECKLLVESEIVVEYASACSFIITSFIYCTFYLLCAWDWIISVPKFVMLFLVLNVLTYFLICLIFTGSLSGIIVYFFPIHFNFLFLLIMCWVTVQSCKDVFGVTKSVEILHLNNFYSFYMFHGADAILCLFPILTGPSSRSYIAHTCGFSMDSVYFQILGQYAFSIMFRYFILLIPIIMSVGMLHDFMFSDKKEKVQVCMVRYTRNCFMYYSYHAITLLLWLCGLFLILLPIRAYIWGLYSFAAVVLPMIYLIHSAITAKKRLSFPIECSENSKEMYRIRGHHI